MLKCIIIDDEPLAIQLLTDYVSKTPYLQLQSSFTDPIEAMHYLNEHEVDFCFLDIQMPELTGIQFMKIVKKKLHFVMTTAYDQYAIEGYEHDVIDFLLKPITLERFMIATEKVKKRLAKSEAKKEIQIKLKEDTGYIFVKSEYKVQKVNTEEILFIESMGDYAAIQLAEAKILTLENMKNLVERLPESQFVRVHRSFIISLSKIDFIERNRVKISDRLIPISSSYQKGFWEMVNGTDQ